LVRAVRALSRTFCFGLIFFTFWISLFKLNFYHNSSTLGGKLFEILTTRVLGNF